MRLISTVLAGLLVLTGCGTAPRRAAPEGVISTAFPDGYTRQVSLIATDVSGFARRSPAFFDGIKVAAGSDPVNILVLSGGGSSGAFSAGALSGLSRSQQRPAFQLVTGVSAGALIAPFAFLGSDWDQAMRNAFTGERSQHLMRSPNLTVLARLLFPRGHVRSSPLFELVDHFVTPAMIDAVAREYHKGRRLVVATTDLDKGEEVLWDMGAIATQGGEVARKLFRNVLIASASVPGVFPPVLIHVHIGAKHYDEMHVDGSVTTPVFALPIAAQVSLLSFPQLHGAHVYMLINGKLAKISKTVPLNTVDLLAASFTTQMTYKTRQAIVDMVGMSRRFGMTFQLSEIPVTYPLTSFVDFSPAHMQALFDYAAQCAEEGQLWLTPEQSIYRNMHPDSLARPPNTACPAAPLH